jgi:[protein-PII] uridylyltransferase
VSETVALRRFHEARSAAAGRASLHAHGRAGVDACAALTGELDADLFELAEPLLRPGFALVAVGGYGRREQCRHSDIDLMLLFEGEPDREAVDGVLYPLWDSGISVGHSVRRLSEVAPAARENVETLTALLDARLVAGDETLYGRFLETRQRLVRKHGGWLRSELVERRAALRAREPWQLQEPDVKTGRGGLRELQAVRWLELAAAIADGTRDPRWTYGRDAAEARERLLATRNALHALAERPNDRLRRDLMAPVAELLGSDRQAWTRALTAAMRRVDAAAGEQLDVQHAAGGRALRRWAAGLLRRKSAREHPTGPARERSDLEELVAALEEASPGPLEPLPEMPWLARLLPEWEVQRSLPHIAPFHLHPVDVHSLRTVWETRQGIEEDEERLATARAAASIPDRRELLLAALLHDIGKGHEGEHSEVGAVIAERFCARAGLGDEATRRLVAAVEHHLLLPTVATRRDIADEQVIREVAQAVGDPQTLDLIYVLSVADARASGPDVWNAWKAQLMRSLYERVHEELSDVPMETAVERRRRAVVDALASTRPAAEVEAHLNALPASYLLSMEPEAIGRHLRLIEQAEGATALDHDRVGEVERLTVVMPDRPGIMQAVTGTLAVHNVNVLGGVAYTRADGVAIEVMHLADALEGGIDERRWGRIFDATPRALSGEFAIDERLAETRATYGGDAPAEIPTSVTVDNAGSERYSIIEVRAADRLGLLYAITSALHELALDIHVAKVDTLGREVVDAFYVLRTSGRRVEERDEIERLVTRVTAAVEALDVEAAAAGSAGSAREPATGG